MYSLETLWGQALADGRLAHAYLIAGEGATAVAQEFLLRIYCKRRCRECTICLKILHRTHPDVQWIRKEGKRISIDQIRQLQKDARYQPLEAPRKVYILEGAEDLSAEAANSLLKILESPPQYVTFLLLTRSVRVLPTILSRCQILRLKPLSLAELRKILESRGFDERETEYILALVHGFPERISYFEREEVKPLARKSDLLEQLRELGDLEVAEFFAHAEGLIQQREATLELIRRLRSQPPHAVLEMAQALSKLSPERLEFFLEEALRWYRDLALVNESKELIFNRDRLDELHQQREDWDTAQLALAMDSLAGVREALQGNANIQLTLESLLFRLADSAARRSAG